MIDSPSSGERKGKSLNACVCKRCSVAMCGLRDFLRCCATGIVYVKSKAEQDWKAWPERVIAP